MASNYVRVVINNRLEYLLEIPDDEMLKLKKLVDRFAIAGQSPFIVKPVKEEK